MKKLLFLFLFIWTSLSLYATDYYVKTDGTGSGTSWEDAMSGERFSQVLPTAEDGSTFFIAEGVYSPTTSDGVNNTDNPNKFQYIVNSDVSIIGGFPANAKEDATSDPNLYKTIFSGDLEWNDKLSFSPIPDHPDKDMVVIDNVTDNTDYLFNVFEQGKVLSLTGIHCTGANKGAVCTTKEVGINLLKCSFSNNGGSAIYIGKSKTCEVKIDSCLFLKNGSGCGYSCIFAARSKASITNSYFERNGEYGLTTGGAVYISSGNLNNLTFIENRSLLATVDIKVGAGISNCVFIDNTASLNCGGIYLEKGHGEIENCVFFNNICYDDPLSATIDQWTDQDLRLQMRGNLIVGKSLYFNQNRLVDIYLDSEHNLFTEPPFSKDGLIEMSPTDRLISLADVEHLFEGHIDADGKFVPELDTTGFIPTVKLKTDKLLDGSSIRFPLETVLQKTDIRGTERCDMTCAGAYEIRDCDEEESGTDLLDTDSNVGHLSITASPNPTCISDGLTLTIRQAQSKSCTLSFFNTMGQLLHQFSTTDFSSADAGGMNTKTVQVPTHVLNACQNAGLVLVKAENEDGTAYTKVVVER